MSHENNKLITGAKDHKVMIFSGKGGALKQEKSIDFGDFPCRGIDNHNGKILLGLRDGSIYELNESDLEGPKKQIMASHHDGEAWGLAIVPQSKSLLSIGDDNKILEFDFDEKKFIKQGIISEKSSKNQDKMKKVTASSMSQYPANQQGRAIAFCPHNNHIAVSNNMGKVTIRPRDDLNKKLHVLNHADEWNEVIRYSPCGKYMAVGSHDNRIYVYETANNYSLYYTCDKHNSFVTSVDWSLDSTYIRSVCGAYEKLYYNIAEKSFDSSGLSNTKDTQWASNSAKIGWDVEGIYPSGEDGSHINGVDMTTD